MNTAAVPEGYRRDSKERLVPAHMIRPTDLLEDQLVEKMMGYADELSSQISRFKAHCFSDVGAFIDLLKEKYQLARGGVKGNMTFTAYDGCSKVQVAIAENMVFGPELQIAKGLIDECIVDWAEGADANLRVLVDHAFKTDQEGQVSREAVFALRRVEIQDDRWKRAMEAVGDSIRIVGSKAYIRFYRRTSPTARWDAITIDMAGA
ncbi:MAG TPA: DUF3164 family protein [Aliidongia sp.]|uniref:DUF3164 family protein n=1 Tax=Aliidongia sp. TaxID=1914230 RepID=UPI002DDD1445|nr:DUF3164 family protein [Aliidongia sp.]HEV2675521.1 DUF3164 family protein [Aliidongia sp.]